MSFIDKLQKIINVEAKRNKEKGKKKDAINIVIDV